jgi:hypothetical protein
MIKISLMDLIADGLLNGWVDESCSCMGTWLKDEVNAGKYIGKEED